MTKFATDKQGRMSTLNHMNPEEARQCGEWKRDCLADMKASLREMLHGGGWFQDPHAAESEPVPAVVTVTSPHTFDIALAPPTPAQPQGDAEGVPVCWLSGYKTLYRFHGSAEIFHIQLGGDASWQKPSANWERHEFDDASRFTPIFPGDPRLKQWGLNARGDIIEQEDLRTPKPQAKEENPWIQCGPGMPNLQPGKYSVAYSKDGGSAWSPELTSLHILVGTHPDEETFYRPIRPS